MNLISNEYRIQAGGSLGCSHEHDLLAALRDDRPPYFIHISDLGENVSWCGMAVHHVTGARTAPVCPKCCLLGVEAQAAQMQTRVRTVNLDAHQYHFDALGIEMPLHLANVDAHLAWCGRPVGPTTSVMGARVCLECCALGLEAEAAQARRRADA